MEEKAALRIAAKRADAVTGPQRLGTSADLVSGVALPSLRACYAAAFQSGVQVFPYYTAE